MTPEVSVIIPVFNRRAMAREAVDSVLANCGVDFELIVVDDGSTRGVTLADLPAQCAVPVKIERIANRGPAAARNHGASVAKAPLLAFLDSDDLWAPEKLSRHLAFMREHPGCEISQTNEVWIRNGRRVNPGLRHRKRAGNFFIESLQTCLVSPSAVMIRAALFHALGGFDESMSAAEDYDLWLRVLVRHEIGLLDEPLVIRRAGHPDQLSMTTPAIDRFRILALVKLLANDWLSDAQRAATVDTLIAKCRIYGAGLKRRGRLDEARFYGSVAARAASSWRIRADESLWPCAEFMKTLLASGTALSPCGARA